MDLILFGAPGTGKGTQAEFLQAELGLTHIATGDLFREHLRNRTRLGLAAQEYMNRGQLVPDEVTIDMVRERMQRSDIKQGVLFDGFPRTLPQAEALTKLMSELGLNIDAVIHLDVPTEEIVTRLSGRFICRECQAPFHKVYNPFQTCPYNKCHGEYLYQRDDDKPETVRERLEVFYKQTRPLIEYYQSAGLLHTVSGLGEIDEVKQAILDVIKSLPQI
jgi:adenylate kinase